MFVPRLVVGESLTPALSRREREERSSVAYQNLGKSNTLSLRERVGVRVETAQDPRLQPAVTSRYPPPPTLKNPMAYSDTPISYRPYCFNMVYFLP
jgi:hypothetical protein